MAIKNFPEPMVTISLAEYESLKESAQDSILELVKKAGERGEINWVQTPPNPFAPLSERYSHEAIIKTMKLGFLGTQQPMHVFLIARTIIN